MKIESRFDFRKFEIAIRANSSATHIRLYVCFGNAIFWWEGFKVDPERV